MEKILDNNYYDLLINNVSIPSYDTGDNITPINTRHSLAHVQISGSDPCSLGRYPYSNFPSLFSPTSTISVEASGIGTVQRNPYLNLFGRGVLVGIVDTGIDYTHQAFLYNDNTTRILSIWDQSVQEGTPPAGFSYGSEYNRDLINIALKAQDPRSIVPVTDPNGHGTAIASVVAGRPNLDNSFSGIIPESELVVVKLKEAKQNLKQIFFVPEDKLCYQESDIMLGISYLIAIAQSLSRSLVICIAVGSNQGGHDGSGALSNYLNYLARLPGIGISVSAGNEGNSSRHYFNNTTAPPFYNDFELRVGEADKIFSMEIWPNAHGRLSIDISSPNRESTQPIYPSIGGCRRFNFIFIPTILWVNNFLFEEETGDQFILLRFQNAQAGIWRFRIQSDDNDPLSFHSWLPSGNMISSDTYFLNPNPDTTITSPGNGTHQLTVTAYNQFNDSILIESSRGYTRNGLVKPDIAAPGYQIPCAVPGNLYGTITGTGAAASHAAGAVGMVLEWAIPRGNYTTITGNDINRLIIRGAQRKNSLTYPNNIWGYGQLDVNNLFQRLTNI